MFIVLDLETTWLNSVSDTIIECAFVKIDRKTFKEVDRYATFVDPEREIPELISGITNIFNTDIEGAPRFQDIRDDIEDFIEGFPVIGHNIPFDLRFLESHGVDISKNPPIDTFFLANFLCYELKSLNLWYLSESLGIELENAHRAIDDTLATKKVFEALIKKMQKLPKKDKELLWFFLWWCQDVGVRIIRDEYLQKPKKEVSDTTWKTYYTSVLQENIWETHEIYKEQHIDNIEEFLGTIPDFELRESQKCMLQTVSNSFSGWEKTLIEAPTGIGKTFAYLLPAIKHSLQFWEAVHVSTSTKALQDQIYYKDLAFLRDHFPQKFSYTKLKGRRNYLWLTSFIDFVSQPEIQSSVRVSFLLKVLFWSMKSDFWELDELDFYGEEYTYVSDVHAGDSFIFDASNVYKNLEFALRARKKAKQANIIITNNHILFQDISSEWSLLWWVKNLVLDEAHTLEDIVTNALKKRLSFQFFQNTFQKIEKKVWKYDSDIDLQTKKQQILFDSSELFSIIEGYIFSNFSLGAKYKSLILPEEFFGIHEELPILAKKILEAFKDIKSDIQALGEDVALYYSRELQDIAYIEEMFGLLFINRNYDTHIYYGNHDERRGTEVYITVLKPGAFLEKHLWNTLDSCVLTSATLQMWGSFSYIQWVLHTHDFSSLVLESDFDYEKQALVFIPDDLGNVKNNLPQLIAFLREVFLTVKGKTLVLLTAFSVIREIFTELKVPMQKQHIHILAQSISGSKNKQIEHFKDHAENSILLGTDTFWEGIDIPWEKLKYLVVHKIPFAVPSDPIFIARSKLYKDSFKEYSIPKSILKLKQWFWRLIRSKKDTWVIIFLDNRVHSSSWGKEFYNAFPKGIKVRSGTAQKFLETLQGNK